MEQFVVLALIVAVVFLFLKNKQLLDNSHTPTSNQRLPALKTYSQDEALRQEEARREEHLRQQAAYLDARNKDLRVKELQKKLENEEAERKEASKREEYLKQQAAHLDALNKELRLKELQKKLENEEAERKEASKREEYLKQQAAYHEARSKEKIEKESLKKLEHENSSLQAKYKDLRREYDQINQQKERAGSKSEKSDNQKDSDLNKRVRDNSYPTFNSGIPEIDGPGMYQRLTGCGPQGHVCYLLFSESHGAYKVGICKPERLGTRIKSIRDSIPDTTLVGTAVFTSHQKAFDAEQKILKENRNSRYHGITGSQSGSSEWITRKPPGRRPSFTTPEFVEQRYQQQLDAPLQRLDISDEYTIYLAYSKAKGAYKAKWCKTSNLSEKIARLQREAPDTQIISRIKIERHGKAREITKELNTKNGSYSKDGRNDIIKWSSDPTYLETFKGWDRNGNHK